MIGVVALAAVAVVGAAVFVGYNTASEQKISRRGNALAMTVAGGQGRPERPAPAATVYGFRSAEFGDDEEAIRAAIGKDFGIGKDRIAVRDGLATGTRALIVRAENLMPDTGAARIGYIMGYESGGLAQVNIIWGTLVSAEATGAQVARTAVMLKSYFSKLGFDPERTVTDRRLRNGGILVFRASDAKSRLVQVVYREVPVKSGSAAGTEEGETGEPAMIGNSADGQGGTKKAYILRLSYVLDPQRPDIIRIEKGAF